MSNRVEVIETAGRVEVVKSPIVGLPGSLGPIQGIRPLNVQERRMIEKGDPNADHNAMFDSLFAWLPAEKVEQEKRADLEEVDECPENACLDSCFPFVG